MENMGPSSELVVAVQHDTGKWSQEWSFSASDGMFGWKGLWNFGWEKLVNSVFGGGNSNHHLRDNVLVGDSVPSTAMSVAEGGEVTSQASTGGASLPLSRTGGTEEETTEDSGLGLRGRFSAGAEVFFSPTEKSAGGEPMTLFAQSHQSDDDTLVVTHSLDRSKVQHDS